VLATRGQGEGTARIPIAVEELPDSPPLASGVKGRRWTAGANLSVIFSYQVRGTASDVDAKPAMLGEAPSSYQYLVRHSSQIEPVVMDTAKSPTLRSFAWPVGRLGEEAAIVKQPVAVYIEKVYEEGDFAQLGI